MSEEEPEYEYEYPIPEPPEPATYAVPKTSPRERFSNIRRLIIFILGCAIMIDALWDRQYVVPELVIGMIMVGVLPLDEFLMSFRRKPRG